MAVWPRYGCELRKGHKWWQTSHFPERDPGRQVEEIQVQSCLSQPRERSAMSQVSPREANCSRGLIGLSGSAWRHPSQRAPASHSQGPPPSGT